MINRGASRASAPASINFKCAITSTKGQLEMDLSGNFIDFLAE